MFLFQLACEAAKRWEERSDEREKKEKAIAAGRLWEADAPERTEARIAHLTREVARWQAAAKRESATPTQVNAQTAGQPLVAASELAGALISGVAVVTPAFAPAFAQERTLADANYSGVEFLEWAMAVSRFVGRITIRDENARLAGYGTGSMVSPRLLLTNNHVLPGVEYARHSLVEFDYQRTRQGDLLPVVTYRLEPDVFFLTHPELDYSLVAVSLRSTNDIELKRYGWSRLIGTQGKARPGEPVNIVQHPRGEVKQIVMRENKILDIFDNFLHYAADTDVGSSGSPVYNDQWELIALHHSSVPRKEDGEFINRNGKPWKKGDDLEELDWVANEGVRISSIVRDVEKRELNAEWRKLRHDLLELQPPDPREAAALPSVISPLPRKVRSPLDVSNTAMSPPSNPSSGAGITLTLPLQITVALGAPVAATPSARDGAFEPQGDAQNVATPDLLAEGAVREFQEAARRPYYDESADSIARDAYYGDLAANFEAMDKLERFNALHELLKRTHTDLLKYKPLQHVYPWVDLHKTEGGFKIKSIYSGQPYDPEQFIRDEVERERERMRLQEVLLRESSFLNESMALEALEAQLPYNCEHVVPQSWFAKKEPMRGDLHHLFACESRCNSFRSNTPYWDFPDFGDNAGLESVRDLCGKSETGRFEPLTGKGAVSRATLYFMVRYPGQINASSKEYTPDRLSVLLGWHRGENQNVSEYEKHRNAAIFAKQGNRNPFIDFPHWASLVNFEQGLGQ